jgi:hypothetical protein
VIYLDQWPEVVRIVLGTWLAVCVLVVVLYALARHWMNRGASR